MNAAETTDIPTMVSLAAHVTREAPEALPVLELIAQHQRAEAEWGANLMRSIEAKLAAKHAMTVYGVTAALQRAECGGTTANYERAISEAMEVIVDASCAGHGYDKVYDRYYNQAIADDVIAPALHDFEPHPTHVVGGGMP